MNWMDETPYDDGSIYLQIQIIKGNTQQTCWVLARPDLRVGKKVKLEDGTWWEIKNIYKTFQTISQLKPNIYLQKHNITGRV